MRLIFLCNKSRTCRIITYLRPFRLTVWIDRFLWLALKTALMTVFKNIQYITQTSVQIFKTFIKIARFLRIPTVTGIMKKKFYISDSSSASMYRSNVTIPWKSRLPDYHFAFFSFNGSFTHHTHFGVSGRPNW